MRHIALFAFAILIFFRCQLSNLIPFPVEVEKVNFVGEETIVLVNPFPDKNIWHINIKLKGTLPDSAILLVGNSPNKFADKLNIENNYQYNGDWYSDSCYVKLWKSGTVETETKIKYSFN
jgi:hypothetical protein